MNDTHRSTHMSLAVIDVHHARGWDKRSKSPLFPLIITLTWLPVEPLINSVYHTSINDAPQLEIPSAVYKVQVNPAPSQAIGCFLMNLPNRDTHYY